MLCNTCKMFVKLIVLAGILASADNVSAEIVASYDGPTDFDGGTMLSLSDVSIGTAGSVSLEFQADNTVVPGTMWYLADSPGGTKGEYRLVVENNLLKVFLWSDLGGYAVDQGVPFTDTTSFHSVSLAWKQGEDTLLTLDGSTIHFGNTCSLDSFSTDGEHTLGRVPVYGYGFQGTIRNVVVTDTYSVPEPCACVLLCTSLLGMLAYAWRKRK